MKVFNTISLATLGLASLSLLTGCQDEDFGYNSEEIAYKTHFEKVFTNYKSVETWDFSTYNLYKRGLEGGPSYNGQTRAGLSSSAPVEGKWFNVPTNISGWLDQNLKEGVKNTDKGTVDFVLRMPDDQDIMIIPIYQGKAGLVWDLGIKDEATSDEEIIWQKSHGIQTYREIIDWTNTTVGDATNYTAQAADFINKKEAGNNDYHNCLLLKNAIPSEFNPDKEWLKVTVTGINEKNGNSSGVFCVTKSDGTNAQMNQTQLKIENNQGSITGEIKNKEMLKAIAQGDTDFRWAMYWSETAFTSENNSGINVSIQRYKIGDNVDGKWEDMKDGDGNYFTDYNNGHTIGKQIRSQALRVDHTKFSGYFSLYLKINNLDDKYNGNNTYREHYASREIQSSTQGMMVALTEFNQNAEFIKNVLDELKTSFNYDGKNIMFLGCEDSDVPKADGVPGADWDMNDVVFLIVGMSKDNVRPNYEELVRKRYMIEDLGGTYDFDFNDVVVDLEQVTNLRTGEKTQKLSLKHLCGTIPWQVKIGEGANAFTSEKLPGRNGGCDTGGDGYDPTIIDYEEGAETESASTNNAVYKNVINVTLPNNPWNPETNNITITTWPKAAGADWNDTGKEQGAYLAEANGIEYTFAQGGEIPYIIACDPGISWMKEGVTIPYNWYSLWKKEIIKTQNKLAIQQSTLYVIKSGTDQDRVRTLEYSTNSPAAVNITCTSQPDGSTAPVCTQDRTTQKFTFDASNATVGTYTYQISQATTMYYEGKDVILTVRVLNEALQVNNLTITPDGVSIEPGQSAVVTYSNGGTGEISVDPIDNITTTINTTDKTITITVDESVALGSSFILHVRQKEDNIYYDADKAVAVSVRQAPTVLDPGNKEVETTQHEFGNNWSTQFTISKEKLDLHEGDELIFKVTNLLESSQINLFNQNWGDRLEFTSLNGDFSLVITSELLSKYQNGLLIQGHNVKLISVTKNCNH